MIPSDYIALMFVLEGIGFGLVINKFHNFGTEPVKNKAVVVLGSLNVGPLLLITWMLFAAVALLAPFNIATAQATNTVYATNTLYQNMNYTSLTVYAITAGGVRAWVGNASNNMELVINDTPPSIVGITPGDQTSTLIVPYGFYYKYNYTGTVTFNGVGT